MPSGSSRRRVSSGHPTSISGYTESLGLRRGPPRSGLPMAPGGEQRAGERSGRHGIASRPSRGRGAAGGQQRSSRGVRGAWSAGLCFLRWRRVAASRFAPDGSAAAMPNACEPEASHRRETRTRSTAQHSAAQQQGWPARPLSSAGAQPPAAVCNARVVCRVSACVREPCPAALSPVAHLLLHTPAPAHPVLRVGVLPVRERKKKK